MKEWTKNLVLIDFQGQEPNRECPLFDYQKIFDGLMQITSDQSERYICAEVVRLVQLKDSCTHRLELLTPDSFSFVKVMPFLVCIVIAEGWDCGATQGAGAILQHGDI